MLLVILGVTVLFFLREAETNHGSNLSTERFTVEKGEGLTSLGERLDNAGLVKNKWLFVLVALKTGQYRTLQAGDYALSGSLTTPEIIEKISSGKILPPGVRLTFPEGWTTTQMAARLSGNDLPGDDFLAIASVPYPKWKEKFPLLTTLPAGQSLEGYLFPDTYIFPPQATGELIVNTFLENFSRKITDAMLAQAKTEHLTLHELVTLASIVEVEVQSENDRRMVADIFLRRLSIGQALQSDATLRFVLGQNKTKYSVEETKTNSLYNTYIHPGLPPGPINNPSLEAIQAVLQPLPNTFFYFLSNLKTGETVFAKTFEEHVANKEKNGL